ncbi:hypothetical protein ISCGN_018707 [Ixodes scapularis]
MPKYCAAEGCGNSVVRCETSAHTFPKDEKLCYLWSRLARPSFPTWVPSKSDRLCSEHFRDEDYIRSPSALKSVHLPTKHNRLNPGALPSVFSKKRKPEDLAEHIEKRRKVTPPCDAARSLEEEDDTWGNTELEVVEQSSAKSVTLGAAAGGQLAAAASPTATALTDSPRTPSAASARGQLAAAGSLNATALTDSPRTPSAASARGQLAAVGSLNATALTDSPRTPSVTQACIKPPSRTRFVQTDVSGTMVWCSSPSHGDDALDTDLDLSDLCPPRAEADSSYCLSEDSFASPEKEAPSLVHERKFIVFESCLDQLLETCRSCAAPNTHIDKTVQGSSLQVSTLCRSGHTETWCSQPVIRRKPVGNILVAAAILFTGCSIKKALRMLSSMGIACFCYKTFFIIQKAFLLPAIEKVWNKHQLELVSAAAGRQLVIAGDGRADSPGHSAKYGTYTMLDVEDNKVLHVETVQSNETGGSYHMELEGLRRSLDIFEAHSLVVAVLVTDRHPQLSAWLEREHPDICHLFDCWHVAKEYVGELMAAVLDISTVMPSYKAAAAHYCRDAPPFLSSAYERADKRALAENHYSRFNS